MLRFNKKSDRYHGNVHEHFLEQEGLIAPASEPSIHQTFKQLPQSPKLKPLSFADQRYDRNPPPRASAPTKSQHDSIHRTRSAHSNASTFIESFTTIASKKRINVGFGRTDRRADDFELSRQRSLQNSQSAQGMKGHAPSKRSFFDRLQFKANKSAQEDHHRPSMLLPPSYEESQHTEDRVSDPLPPVFGQLPGFAQDRASIRYDQPGAAARAAAALQKKLEKQLQDMNISTINSNQDSESGIGVELEDTIKEPVSPIGQDPIRYLPAELMLVVLGCLDAYSLISAECVSKQWLKFARNPRVWRQVFYRDFNDAFDDNFDSTPMKVAPADHVKSQDWKELWQIRTLIDRRWQTGRAGAIYLDGHTDCVYCVQFDRDIIVTGSRDRTIRIWATQSHQCLRILGVPTTRARELQPLPMSSFGIGQKPIARIFPLPFTAEKPKTLNIYHEGSILCLQYDKQILVTGSSDSTLIIWAWRPAFDCVPVRHLRGHFAGVLDVCFNDVAIVSCSKDSTLCHWNRQTGALVQKLRGHVGPVNAVKLKGNLAVSAGGDGTTRLWDLAAGVCVRSFSGDHKGLACVEFSLNTSKIFAGGNNKVIREFDSRTGAQVQQLRAHEDLVRSLHLDSSNQRLISGSYDKTVKAFDLRTGKNILSFEEWTSSWILCVKSDYRRIVATSQDGRVVMMDFGYGIAAANLLESWK